MKQLILVLTDVVHSISGAQPVNFKVGGFGGSMGDGGGAGRGAEPASVEFEPPILLTYYL